MKKHPFLYSFVVILLLWLLLYWGIHKPFIPSPLAVGFYMATHFKLILIHLGSSFYRIIVAIFITVLLGGITGILLARSQRVDRFLSPIIYTLFPIPKIAFLPLLMLFLGLGNASKITLVATILFFQIVISVRDGVKSIPEGYYLVMKSMNASAKEVYRHLIFPALLPSLFTALRISVGTSISVLFFAENYATQRGIGYFIMDAWIKLDYVGMFSGIIAISLMGIVMFLVLDKLEAHFCKWHH